MRTLTATFVTLLALSFATPAAWAGDGSCDPPDPCDPDYTLTMPTTVSIGEAFQACVTAPAGSRVYLLVSGTAGTTNTKFGPLGVKLPLLTLWEFSMGNSCSICLPHLVECVKDVVGFTGYFQFVAVGPAPGQVGISNMASLTATDDGICDVQVGDFRTFTMGGWGAPCNGNNPGCLRDQWFSSVYPAGLLLGDSDGIDLDSFYSLLLTDAPAVQAFLPQGKTPSVFTADTINPTKSSAGVFSGQLAAAKLNVGFDDAGIFDTVKSQTLVLLGDLIYRDGVHAKLIGKTVRDVIGLADLAISGELPAPVDVDGDLIGDVSLSDLSDALDVLNNNFDNGTVNLGNLKLP